MVFYLIYKSRALIDAKSPEHQRILDSCHLHNAVNGVSGFLHREGGFFIQYIEGARDRVLEVMGRIRDDPRHDNIVVLEEGLIKRRHLGDWNMGFATGEQLSLGDLLGLRDGEPDFEGVAPFDLVVFVIANSEALSETADTTTVSLRRDQAFSQS